MLENQLMSATYKEAAAPTVCKGMRLYSGYDKYIAAKSKYISPESREARVAFAKKLLGAWDIGD